MPSFGVVVLAAGGSSRFGRPKQLLPYLGRTLVEHAVRTALASGAAEVVVVVGAEGPEIRKRLQGLRVRIVTNEAWTEGMGGSIAKGVAALQTVDAVVVALADQPRITPDHLRSLAEQTAASPRVASSYDGILGAPCAFARSEFLALLALKGEMGARHLIRNGEVAVIEFAAANIDVDTPADYVALVPAPTEDAPADPIRDPNATRGPPGHPVSIS